MSIYDAQKLIGNFKSGIGSALNKVGGALGSAEGFVRGDVPSFVGLMRRDPSFRKLFMDRLVERAAPDIRNRRKETDSINDDLFKMLRERYETKIKSDPDYNPDMEWRLGNSIKDLYDPEGRYPNYASNRSNAVDQYTKGQLAAKYPNVVNSLDFDPRLYDVEWMRNSGSNAFFDETTDDIKLDSRNGREDVGQGVSTHEFAHASYFNQPEDERIMKVAGKSMMSNPKDFLDKWKQVEWQDSPLGKYFRDNRENLERLYSNQPQRLIEEMYATMHEVPPEDLRDQAPELYPYSAWK